MSRAGPAGRPAPAMGRAQMLAVLRRLAALAHAPRARLLKTLPAPAVRALEEEWWWQAHSGQHAPERAADGGAWRIWAIVAGRGFGKTRAGAEWVLARARETADARIALVAATLDEAARVMVEGESGLLAAARSDEDMLWLPSRGTLLFPSGATAFTYSAARPASLRGPQHHFAWCDELAKWERADAMWDNLMLGLRLGQAPLTLVTTTPRPVPLLKRVLATAGCAVTRGRTDDNPHLPADFRTAVTRMYGGTRLGRQELDGELIEDRPGALWPRELIDGCRVAAPARAALRRIVVGVDPPASADGDACGIVVCGADEAARLYVLADLSMAGLRPEGWARRVAAAAADWEAQLVIAEKNQGGEMVASVLRGVDAGLPVRLVSAGTGKAARAEPVALRFETGQARLAGRFPDLEDELAAFTHAGYDGAGSPDRADAMVWALAELIRPGAAPRIARL